MEHDLPWRGGVFLALFAAFAGLEALVPRRPRRLTRQRRWSANLALAVLLPLLAIGAALDAEARGWGLFNRAGLPGWVEAVLAILILDLAIRAHHLVTHKVPLCWRFRRVSIGCCGRCW